MTLTLLALVGALFISNALSWYCIYQRARENQNRCADIARIDTFIDSQVVPRVNTNIQNLETAFTEIVNLKARDEFFHGGEDEFDFGGPVGGGGEEPTAH